MSFSRADLDMADRHVAQGEWHVKQQELLIARLRDHGLPTGEAEDLLEEFRATLEQHQEHRRVMLKDVASPSP